MTITFFQFFIKVFFSTPNLEVRALAPHFTEDGTVKMVNDGDKTEPTV